MVGQTKVPAIGSADAKIMVVGEAPGVDEEQQKQPFVGVSGQFLTRYLSRAGFQRSEVFLTNLCKYRPKGNKFALLKKTVQLKEGLAELSEEIEKVNPNVILAVGAWPMFYLTGKTSDKGGPGTGISNWRGSVVAGIGDHIPAAEGRKVLITYHPAFVTRPEGFNLNPIFLNDLRKLQKEVHSPVLSYPPYESFIDPDHLPSLAADMAQSDWLTVDIETFGNDLACIGFADSTHRGLCVTYECPYGWEIAQSLLASDQPKIFQYGTFDINWLQWWKGWETSGFAFDTYIAAANLMPGFPKGLGFLTSIYTPFPYYKEDRKAWKKTGDMTSLWEYNIMDVIATHWIAMEQMKELEELYG